MKSVLDYIKLIPLGLKNPWQVLEGIVNNVKLDHGNLSQDIQEEIIRRRVICKSCPFMSKNVEHLTGIKFSRKEDFCTLCSCPILTKTASMSSSCGAATYNANHPENLQEVKWDSYDSKS